MNMPKVISVCGIGFTGRIAADIQNKLNDSDELAVLINTLINLGN